PNSAAKPRAITDMISSPEYVELVSARLQRAVKKKGRARQAARPRRSYPFLTAGVRNTRRLAFLVPALVLRVEDLRRQEVVRVNQQAEFRPLALREPHGERRLAPGDLVIDAGAFLRHVGDVTGVV